MMSHPSHPESRKNTSKPEESMLNQAIVELYMTIKSNIREYSQNDLGPIGDEEKEDELQRLKTFGNLVLIDYIRSSLDILLGLRIEATNQERDTVINSSRGGHGEIPSSQRS